MTTQWQDPRSFRIQSNSIIPFKQKYLQFRTLCCHNAETAPIRITVSRATIFEDSYQQISCLPPHELRKRLFISFRGEEGLDYGGVAR